MTDIERAQTYVGIFINAGDRWRSYVPKAGATVATPKRIQLSRRKGWRKPEGVVVVSRPSRWGNPFRIGEDYRIVLSDGSHRDGHVADAAHAVALFADYLTANPDHEPIIREHLAGHDLACWCPLSEPCHADVLLEIAAARHGEETRP